MARGQLGSARELADDSLSEHFTSASAYILAVVLPDRPRVFEDLFKQLRNERGTRADQEDRVVMLGEEDRDQRDEASVEGEDLSEEMDISARPQSSKGAGPNLMQRALAAVADQQASDAIENWHFGPSHVASIVKLDSDDVSEEGRPTSQERQEANGRRENGNGLMRVKESSHGVLVFEEGDEPKDI